MSDGEFLVIAALLRKLGGEVTITDKEMQEAREMEVLRCDSEDFFWNTKWKVRPKPVTIEGEAVAEDALPQANLTPHIKHLQAIASTCPAVSSHGHLCDLPAGHQDYLHWNREYLWWGSDGS